MAEQKITITPSTLNVAPGENLTFDVIYETANPEDESLSGLGLRLHYDSSALSFNSLDNRLQTSLQPFGGTQQDDTQDFDSDPGTDSFVLLSWADFNQNWPGAETTPATLYTANFTAAPDFSSSTPINFTASSTASGYTLDAPPDLTVELQTNQPPVAAEDTITTTAGTPVTIDVLANDTDPDNDTLSLGTFDTISGNGGTIALSNGNQLLYTPAAGFTGTDTLNYTVSDGTDTAAGAVTVTVNQAAGITVTPTTGLTTTEAGGTATFTVALDSAPTANVTITVSSDDTLEGSVEPATLTFTPANFATPQIVTVTGVDDDTIDGAQTYNIALEAASTDGAYDTLTASVAASNTDDGEPVPPGITVTPTTGLTTTEAGGTATFTVALDSAPTANVTITVSSDDTLEGTVEPATLTFTPANFATPQIVTVTGVDDDTIDGAQTYNIALEAASTDGAYDTLTASVAASNTDDGEPVPPGITVTPTTGLTTTEAGGTATFTVVLESAPTADVTIAVSSSDTLEGSVSPATLTFTPANFATPQIVTVTGADDTLTDGGQPYTINLTATSDDTIYGAIDPDDVSVVNIGPGLSITPTTGLTTTEAGGTATFTVALGSEPTADVTIAVSSSNVQEGTVSPEILTFTADNFDQPQTVTLTGADDDSIDGSQTYSVTLTATSDDTIYGGIADTLQATNTDNDAAALFTVTPTSGLITSEAGDTATFTVALKTAPTANVTIPVSSSNPQEGTVSPATLTFTPENFATAQTVTVTGADDTLADGSSSYNIVLALAVSDDTIYGGADPADVLVQNIDNDGTAPGITVIPSTGLITTEAGGAVTLSVALSSAPTADVTIAVSSDDTTEGAVSPATLTFTPENFGQIQTVTVTGVDDDTLDGSQPYNIVFNAASAGDAAYDTLAEVTVPVSNTDDEQPAVPGISVTPTTGLTTTEAGGTATFTVALNSAPTAPVTIALTGVDTTEGAVSPATLTFTAENFSTAQTVTVTGVDEFDVDGSQTYTITLDPTSADTAYDTLIGSVAVTNTDNDTVSGGVTPPPPPQNIAPTISDIANQTVSTGAATQAIAFTVSDAETAAANLTVTATSSDKNIVPDNSIVLGGEGANRTITVTPAANQSGAATITVTVSDGTNTTSDTFTLDVSNKGSGNDTLTGTDSGDTLGGGLGNDYISGGAGDDVIDAGDGDDTVVAGTGNDEVSGVGGNDILIGNEGADSLNGGDGNDILYGNTGIDILDGGAGNDTCLGGKDADSVTGNTGDDVVGGDIGNDSLSGGDGNDRLFGNQGNDLLNGDDGNDTLAGGKDSDTLNGMTGDDVLVGNIGTDSLMGGDGNDLLFGNSEADVLDGGTGNDTLYGGKGADTLSGNTGNDFLSGDLGSDSLSGGAGNDTLTGAASGPGNPGAGELDTLTGGEGADRFVLGSGGKFYYTGAGNADYALIADFSAGEDVIQLSGSAADYVLAAPGAGLPAGTAIFRNTAGADDLVAIVQGTSNLSLTDGSFSFV